MPSLLLALEDFVPVVLTALGLRFVVSTVRRADPAAGSWAARGAILIIVGGLTRATWKTIVALGGPDIGVLFAILYPALAFGYLVLAVAIWHGGTTDRQPGASRSRMPVWAPAAIGAAILVPSSLVLAQSGGRLLPVAWLSAATLGSLATSILLARWAGRVGHPRLGWLFLFSLALTLGLNGLARVADQSEALQWVEQLTNTANQAVFLLAAWRLDVVSSGDRGHLNTRYGV